MEKKTIRCQDCYNNFIFTVKQQERYAENGWTDPIRCPSCRARKKEIWATTTDYQQLMEEITLRKCSPACRSFFRKIGR